MAKGVGRTHVNLQGASYIRNLRGLPADQRRPLAVWMQYQVDRILAELDGEELEISTPREVVGGSRRQHAGMTVQLEKVRCGKKSCKRCPHGPYWYGYRREGGRLKSVYIGKKLPEESTENGSGYVTEDEEGGD